MTHQPFLTPGFNYAKAHRSGVPGYIKELARKAAREIGSFHLEC